MRSAAAIVSGLVLTLALAPAAQAGWVSHNAPEFGFSANFPAPPKTKTTVNDGVTLTSFSGAATGALCIVMAGDYPYVINPDDETVASRDNFVKGVGAKLTTSKRTTFSRGAQQLPAMSFEAESPKMKFKSLIVIEGSRAYQIAGGVPIPDGDTAELDACVGGLILTPKR